MFRKSWLYAFADDIPDADAQTEFRAGIGRMEFFEQDGIQTCVGNEVRRVFAGTSVQKLAEEFGNGKYLDYIHMSKEGIRVQLGSDIARQAANGERILSSDFLQEQGIDTPEGQRNLNE